MAKGVVHIVIIDDEASVQKILAAFAERFFKARKVQTYITTISDPVEALFELSTSEKPFPEIVLLDVRMPKVKGNHIYESVAMVTPQYVNRICFVTGFAGDINLGDNVPILKKPFHYDDFEKVMKQLIAAIQGTK